MLNRLLALLIVGFWLAMTGLLVVREMYPESTRLNTIPVGYVGQIVFQHQQSSDLEIYSGAKEVAGLIHLQPRPVTKAPLRELDLNGNLNITLPNGSRHRLWWLSRIEMTPQFTVERFHVDLAAQEPAHHLDILVNCTARNATIAEKVGGDTLRQTTFTLDEHGLGALLGKAHLDAGMLQNLKSASDGIPPLEFGAQTSSLTIGGEKLSTYLFTLKAGTQTIIEAQVSQLGQVLKAQAPLLGYKLLPFGIKP